MENEIKYIDEKAIGPYIQKCLSELNDKDTNWLGAEVYRRVNSGDEAKGQVLATWHQKAKQWVKGDHTPSMEILFALSGIFGKSINELMAGKDLPDFDGAHLSLYSVAKSNSAALYKQLCSFEADWHMDEYGKSLLDYVLDFRSDEILSAMLDNKDHPIGFYGSLIVDPTTGSSISIGRLLPTVCKNQPLFEKIYSPMVPWSFDKSETNNSAEPYAQVSREDVALFLKMRWAEKFLLRKIEQKGYDWAHTVNPDLDGKPDLDLPYLHGAYNCALEESLRSGDISFAWLGASFNSDVMKALIEKSYPMDLLSIDRYGRVVCHNHCLAMLAYLSKETIASIESENKDPTVVEAINQLTEPYAELEK